jgi:hypothetical protein
VSRSLFPLLFLGLLAPASVSAPKAEERRPVHYYPTEAGTRREYLVRLAGCDREFRETEVVQKVEPIDGGFLLTVDLSTNGSDKSTRFALFRTTAAGLEQIEHFGKKLDPPMWVIKGPVKKGLTWIERYRANGDKEEVTIAEEEEVVEVPAGKFKAVRLDQPGYRVWYAPGVGIVKSIQDDVCTTELTSFTRGPAVPVKK